MDDKKWDEIKKRWAERQPDFKKVTKEPKDFYEDLKRGQNAEHNFFQKYQHCLVRLDGKFGDFEILKSGEKIELKTDYFDTKKTNNLFIEKYSYDEVLGGPWRAKDDGSVYYIYHFNSSNETFIFNTAQLLKRIMKLEKTLRMISVQNKRYVTKGYLVDRELVKDLRLHPEEIGLFETKVRK